MKQNAKLITIIGGILTIVSAWLPWVKAMGVSMNGFQGDMAGNPGIFFVILGALAAIMAILNKKWSAIVAIIMGLIVVALGIKYIKDAGEFKGYGLYVMLAAGLLILIGSFSSMRK